MDTQTQEVALLQIWQIAFITLPDGLQAFFLGCSAVYEAKTN